MTRQESDLSDNSVVKRINECLGEGRNSSIDSLFSGKLAILFIYLILLQINDLKGYPKLM